MENYVEVIHSILSKRYNSKTAAFLINGLSGNVT